MTSGKKSVPSPRSAYYDNEKRTTTLVRFGPKLGPFVSFQLASLNITRLGKKPIWIQHRALAVTEYHCTIEACDHIHHSNNNPTNKCSPSWKRICSPILGKLHVPRLLAWRARPISFMAGIGQGS